MGLTFAVTGCGRSGTVFLSRILARGDFVVRHEEPHDRRRSPMQVAEAFRQRAGGYERYGEVSGYLRDALLALGADQCAVVIRHPHHIIRSVLGRWPRRRGVVDQIATELAVLDHYIVDRRVRLVRFERMTRDVDYVRRLAGRLGISGLKIQDTDLVRKWNASERFPGELPDLGAVQWFVDRYYGGGTAAGA